ncbi:hypothetical protein GPALN_011200 [Globodera pallida]|nr:hypothetical protein GPALN_011200 [Globodera pallida]
MKGEEKDEGEGEEAKCLFWPTGAALVPLGIPLPPLPSPPLPFSPCAVVTPPRVPQAMPMVGASRRYQKCSESGRKCKRRRIWVFIGISYGPIHQIGGVLLPLCLPFPASVSKPCLHFPYLAGREREGKENNWLKDGWNGMELVGQNKYQSARFCCTEVANFRSAAILFHMPSFSICPLRGKGTASS